MTRRPTATKMVSEKGLAYWHACLYSEEGHTNGHRYANKPPLLQCRARIRHEVAQKNADNHGQQDPDGQVAVEPAQGFEGGDLLLGCVIMSGILLLNIFGAASWSATS